MTTHDIPVIMTFSDCQKILRVGKNTFLDLLHSGKLEGFRIGNRWRITRDSLVEYVNHT